ncbi:MAG: nitrate reductase cytochrome c-type subunit [Burkholderiales bacterium]|nr:nitrate reductase cytochrome c-type subunit [Burkholderiales bacterium]
MKKIMLLVALTLACGYTVAQDQQANPNASFTPPMIPHPVANYLPITPDKNMCLMCHKPADEHGMAPALPANHLEDGKIAPSRYECMMCHAESPHPDEKAN